MTYPISVPIYLLWGNGRNRLLKQQYVPGKRCLTRLSWLRDIADNSVSVGPQSLIIRVVVLHESEDANTAHQKPAN